MKRSGEMTEDKRDKEVSGVSGEVSGGFFAKLRKRKVAVLMFFFIIGGPFVYLALISAVLVRPEVMHRIGLEPFIAFMIEWQDSGYRNLTQLQGAEFADYFFHFHAASVLVFGFFFFATAITAPFFFKEFLKIKTPELEKEIEKVMKRYFPEGVIGKFWVVTGFAVGIWSGWFVLYYPWIADNGGKFSVLGGSIWEFVVFTMLAMPIFYTSWAVFYHEIILERWSAFRHWLQPMRIQGNNDRLKRIKTEAESKLCAEVEAEEKRAKIAMAVVGAVLLLAAMVHLFYD